MCAKSFRMLVLHGVFGDVQGFHGLVINPVPIRRLPRLILLVGVIYVLPEIDQIYFLYLFLMLSFGLGHFGGRTVDGLAVVVLLRLCCPE